MGDDLKKGRLLWVRKELDQIGVAVSVVGTSRYMLRKLAGYLKPSIEALHGERKEMRRLRKDLERARYNLLKSPTLARSASRNIWAARDLMDEVLKLKDKGLLDTKVEYDEGRITLVNAWGYTQDELKTFRTLLRQVVADLSHVGLYRDLAYGAVRLDPDAAGGQLMDYDERADVFVADPEKGRTKAAIYEAFGGRVWSKLFTLDDRQTWGTRSRFLRAFVKAMRGRRLDSEDRAILQVTVGRIAGSDWPTAA